VGFQGRIVQFLISLLDPQVPEPEGRSVKYRPLRALDGGDEDQIITDSIFLIDDFIIVTTPEVYLFV
jgi:hypothetical protein